MYQFMAAMALTGYFGLSRLRHVQSLTRGPMLTGILRVLRLPPQCAFWRLPASPHHYVKTQASERLRAWAKTGFAAGTACTVCQLSQLCRTYTDYKTGSGC